ncbi:MAG: hypothetical protein M1826_006966 [Phylliscum demangeonii]|nr:MAG: hypothetical protein M1826_006966 [Phylliscum demangeonii]
MCIVIRGHTTLCGHQFTYRPIGLCARPRQQPDCARGWQTNLVTPCKACLPTFTHRPRQRAYAALATIEQLLLPLQAAEPQPPSAHDEHAYQRALADAQRAISDYEALFALFNQTVSQFTAFIADCYCSFSAPLAFGGPGSSGRVPLWPPSPQLGMPTPARPLPFRLYLRGLRQERVRCVRRIRF